MARRAKRVSEYKGRFHRTIGKIVSVHGELLPRKFLLGTDRTAAEIANRLLERLWDEVVAEHEAAVRFQREWEGRLGDCDLISGVVDYQRLRSLDHGPVWRRESLLIAEAIRNQRREVLVEPGVD